MNMNQRFVYCRKFVPSHAVTCPHCNDIGALSVQRPPSNSDVVLATREELIAAVRAVDPGAA